MKVLVVDDEEDVRALLSVLMEVNGIEAHAASNAAQALTALSHGQYDVVVLDVNMPDLSGIDALPLILAHVPPPRVIVLSGEDGRRAEAEAAGAQVFITKPFDIGELVAAIRQEEP